MTTLPESLGYHLQPRPVLPDSFTAAPDGLKGGWWVNHPRGRAGHVFPHVVADLAGDWHGRRVWQDAVRFKAEGDELGARRLAFAHVCRRDPSEISFGEALEQVPRG